MVAKWMPIAQKYRGTKEIKGGENPVILGFFESVGHDWVKEDEVAWCAAYVGAVLEEAGIRSTSSLAARSYLKWGKEVKTPRYGDIVVFWRGKKNSWQGHVGFFVREEGNYIYCLGGNQRNAVNVSRYPKSRLLGYRRPSSLSNSRTVGGAGAAAVGVAIEKSAELVKETQSTFLNFPVEYMQYIGLAIAFVGLAAVVYARWDDIVKKGR